MQTINITVPRGWHELIQKQLSYLFFLVSEGYNSTAIKTLVSRKYRIAYRPKRLKAQMTDLFAVSVPDSNMNDFTVHIAIRIGGLAVEDVEWRGSFQREKRGKSLLKHLKCCSVFSLLRNSAKSYTFIYACGIVITPFSSSRM